MVWFRLAYMRPFSPQPSFGLLGALFASRSSLGLLLGYGPSGTALPGLFRTISPWEGYIQPLLGMVAYPLKFRVQSICVTHMPTSFLWLAPSYT